ncbi:AraC family transcriptional regulator [Microbacterium sp. H1-D42]|uniref:helix-turn-helix domain-containing protein n=1 Tax=Microbacterium sp. H1-D42 TaxID=2925844 RepID=UPI001F536293|nr:AraC family transcriptional regulator [Microbacterium sp. H1-D42]UNK70727.1 AraC family transcriptional regulator [Microbacterium sp. H1-D42]
MDTASDTFAAFVDRLAEAMADDQAGRIDAAALASGFGFSRYHFDRLIRQMADESPGAFRRRILLERAAFRMLTTDALLIDIAVDAGYGSHEAFTRAFQRSFGEAPAQWRRQPGQIRIAAANDVHFHPPGSIRLPPRDEVTEMDLLTSMVEHHVRLTGEMIAVAGRLDDAELDQPIVLDVDEDVQTIRSLLARLVGQLAMWNAVMAGRSYDLSVEAGQSLGEMRGILDVEGPAFLAHVRDVTSENRLDETFVDASGEPVEMISYGGNLAHILTFAAHRRTLVLLALDAHGQGELGWGDPRFAVAEARG